MQAGGVAEMGWVHQVLACFGALYAWTVLLLYDICFVAGCLLILGHLHSNCFFLLSQVWLCRIVISLVKSSASDLWAGEDYSQLPRSVGERTTMNTS